MHSLGDLAGGFVAALFVTGVLVTVIIGGFWHWFLLAAIAMVSLWAAQSISR